MDATKYVTYLVGAAAGIGALVYIGHCVAKLTQLVQLLARLPDEHAQLLEATKTNTANIAQLTRQVSQLTADVSKLAGSP